MGKPAGNGHPLSVVATTRAIADAFNDGREYFNTFGGNPVSCAVGLEVLKTIKEEKLQENADIQGQFLKQKLSQLREKYPVIGDIRGEGLFLGIDLVKDPNSRTPNPELAAFAVERLKDFGILLDCDGPGENVMCVKPPIIIEKKDLEYFVDRFETILTEWESKTSP